MSTEPLWPPGYIEKGNYDSLYIVGTRLPSTNRSKSEYLDALQAICDIYDQYSPVGTCIIAGDLNADIHRDGNTMCQRAKVLSDHLFGGRNIISTSILSPETPKYTYRSKDMSKTSTLDYICIPGYMRGYIASYCVHRDVTYDVSDHYPLSSELVLQPCSLSTSTSRQMPIKWSKADETHIRLYKSEVDKLLNFSTQHYNASNIEQYNSQITNGLHIASISTIPNGIYRQYLKPYWKSDRLDAHHYDMRCRRREWKHAGKPRDVTSEPYTKYKASKREFRKRKRQAEANYRQQIFNDIADSCDVDINFFYKTIRSQRRKTTTINHLEYNGSRADSPEDIANMWREYYADLATPDIPSNPAEYDITNDDITSLMNRSLDNTNIILQEPISIEEIEHVIKTLKCRKSPGPDGICNEHIKHASNSLKTHLVKLFNLIIQHEYAPLPYRTGFTIALYKNNGKSKHDPQNYRGITITSSLGKLLEKVIMERIHRWSNENMAFPDELQFGFRKNSGADMAALTLQECIMYFKEHSSVLYATFLDNEKAFDKIWQNGLLLKLYNLGMNAKCWRFLKHSYTTSKSFVIFQGCHSSYFNIRRGVGQGRVLSAWLFLVYIDGLIKELKLTGCGINIANLSIPTIILADDTTLLSTSIRNMQTMIDTVNAYAIKWRLKYNPNKSCVIAFNKSIKHPLSQELVIGGKLINRVDQTKYAGVIFACDKLSERRTNAVCEKAMKTMNSLYTSGLHIKGFNPIISTKIWKTVILPSSFYGCELMTGLSRASYDKLELTQRKFARRAQGFPQRSACEPTISSLGLWTMQSYFDKRKLLLFGRISRQNTTYISKRLFLWLLGKYLAGIKITNSFIHEVLHLFFKYDLLCHLHSYVSSGTFVDKLTWSKVVHNKVKHREYSYISSLPLYKPDLKLFYDIHPSMSIHHLWKIAYIHPLYTVQISSMIQIAAAKRFQAECELCMKHVNDYRTHIILHCERLVHDRNLLFDELASVLDIGVYITLCDQDDDTLMNCLLGGENNDLWSIDWDTWEQFILSTSRFIHTCKSLTWMYCR